MKRLLLKLAFASAVLLSSVFTSCNEIETINKGWWYLEVTGKQANENSDIAEIERALSTVGMFAHDVSFSDAEAAWKWFLEIIDDQKVILEGDDFCKVTMTWDSDYDNPGIMSSNVGMKLWQNKMLEERY